MKRKAFVAVTMDRVFGIGLAVEEERGYYPQAGFGSFDSYDAATDKAHQLNDQLGLDRDDAAMIVASSMRAQNTAKRSQKVSK